MRSWTRPGRGDYDVVCALPELTFVDPPDCTSMAGFNSWGGSSMGKECPIIPPHLRRNTGTPQSYCGFNSRPPQ